MNSITMLLENFPHAVAGGFIIAGTCALLGVFVILKRVVFIGVALSQVAALGVAVAFIISLHPYIGAAVLTLITVMLLSYPFESRRISRDAILGIIFVLASALSILIVSKSGFGLHEVQALLYGDLIFTSPQDLAVIAAALIPVTIYILMFLRPTVYTFMDREAAHVLKVKTSLWEFLFFVALGLAVSISSKTAGALLVFCYLVVAPSAALMLSRRLAVVMVISVATAFIATFAGMCLAVEHDLPTNHIIAASTCLLFALACLPSAAKGLKSLLAPRHAPCPDAPA